MPSVRVFILDEVNRELTDEGWEKLSTELRRVTSECFGFPMIEVEALAIVPARTNNPLHVTVDVVTSAHGAPALQSLMDAAQNQPTEGIAQRFFAQLGRKLVGVLESSRDLPHGIKVGAWPQGYTIAEFVEGYRP
jgi:hypothetical protein